MVYLACSLVVPAHKARVNSRSRIFIRRSGGWRWRTVFSTRAHAMSPKERRKVVSESVKISLARQYKFCRSAVHRSITRPCGSVTKC